MILHCFAVVKHVTYKNSKYNLKTSIASSNTALFKIFTAVRGITYFETYFVDFEYLRVVLNIKTQSTQSGTLFSEWTSYLI